MLFEPADSSERTSIAFNVCMQSLARRATNQNKMRCRVLAGQLKHVCAELIFCPHSRPTMTPNLSLETKITVNKTSGAIQCYGWLSVWCTCSRLIGLCESPTFPGRIAATHGTQGSSSDLQLQPYVAEKSRLVHTRVLLLARSATFAFVQVHILSEPKVTTWLSQTRFIHEAFAFFRHLSLAHGAGQDFTDCLIRSKSQESCPREAGSLQLHQQHGRQQLLRHRSTLGGSMQLLRNRRRNAQSQSLGFAVHAEGHCCCCSHGTGTTIDRLTWPACQAGPLDQMAKNIKPCVL